MPTRKAGRTGQKGPTVAIPTNTAHVRHYCQSDDSVPRLFDAYYLLDPFPEYTFGQNDFTLAAAICLVARDSMATALAAWLAGDSRYLGATCHIHRGEAVGAAQEINHEGEVGELSGDTCPDYVGMCIRRYTDAHSGPASRGRVFIPCVAEINTNTSFLNGAGQTAAAGIVAALDADIDLEDYSTLAEPAHWNRKDASTDRVVQWIYVRELVTQRRRRLRPLQ